MPDFEEMRNAYLRAITDTTTDKQKNAKENNSAAGLPTPDPQGTERWDVT